MKEKIIALLKQFGLVTDDKVQTLNEALEKLEIDEKAKKIDVTKINDENLKQITNALQEQINLLNEQNKALLNTLNEEKRQREAAIKTHNEEIARQKAAKITGAIEKAMKEGKIIEAKKDWAKKYAETDFDSFSEWLKDTPVDPHFKSGEKGKQGSGSDSSRGNDGGETKIKSPIDVANPGLLSKIKEFAQINEN